MDTASSNLIKQNNFNYIYDAAKIFSTALHYSHFFENYLLLCTHSISINNKSSYYNINLLTFHTLEI